MTQRAAIINNYYRVYLCNEIFSCDKVKSIRHVAPSKKKKKHRRLS